MKNTLILRRILIGGIFATLLVPFVSFSSLYFPWITGKAYLFRVLVEVLLGLWIVLAIFDKDYRPKKSCVLWSSVVFLIVMFFANLKGLDPDYSFWSNFERMEGYVTLVHLFAFFLVVSAVFNTKNIWDTFLNTLVGTTIAHSLYAMLQASGRLEIGMSIDRIDGTFGNAIYLAAFMLLSVFITLYLWMKGNKYHWAKYFYGSAIVLQIITIFLTATRGTIIALFVGLFVALTTFLILDPKKKVLRYILLGFIIVSALFATLIFGFKESSIVQNTVAFKRMSEISISSGTVQARFINWGIAWNAVKENPLLGYGQGNYSQIFDKNYDVRMWSQEQWFDRVHSLIFDWLIAGGFLGLISYLAIIVSAVCYLWKSSSNFSKAEKSALTAFFVAYIVHTFFAFDSLTSYLLLFLILAMIHSRSAKDFGFFQKNNLPKNVAGALALIILIATPVSVWAINADGYFQNRDLIKAMSIKSIEDVPAGLEYFKKALARESFGQQEVLLQLMDFGNKVLKSPDVNKEIKQEFVNVTLIAIDEYLKENPEDSRLMYITGQYVAQTGNLDAAILYFDAITKISPKKQMLYEPKIGILIQQGKKEEALELAKTVYEINVENDNYWRFYVVSALNAGRTDLYTKLVEEAFATNRGDRVIALAESNLRANPENAQAFATLAVAHYRSGESQKAIEILNELALKFPQSKSQTDLIIKKIEAGEPIF